MAPYFLLNPFNQFPEIKALAEYFKGTINALPQEQSQIAPNISYEGVPIINDVLKWMLLVLPSFMQIRIFHLHLLSYLMDTIGKAKGHVKCVVRNVFFASFCVKWSFRMNGIPKLVALGEAAGQIKDFSLV